MTDVDQEKTQATLDSLRLTRRKLYSIPESELGAMSLQDQVNYGDNLLNTNLAILKLETAMLKGVNEEFKAREDDLKSAAASLESDLAELSDSVQMIRCASEGLILVTNIIKLLA